MTERVKFENNQLIVDGRPIITILPHEGMEKLHGALCEHIHTTVRSHVGFTQQNYGGFGRIILDYLKQHPDPLTSVR